MMKVQVWVVFNTTVGSEVFNYSDADFYFHVMKIYSNSNVDWPLFLGQSL